jgi:hypothetical protein
MCTEKGVTMGKKRMRMNMTMAMAMSMGINMVKNVHILDKVITI